MVSSFTQLLALRYKGKLDQDADDYIHFALDGAARMSTLIQALLEFSRAGRRASAKTPTDSAAALEAALANLGVAVEESGARISRGDLPTVLSDPALLSQVFQNLVANAIKFRRGPAPAIRVAAAARGMEWEFTVADDGIGIAPKDSERVFLLFHRLHPRAEFPGAGIGLAICKRIVERQGGRIWVESEPGRGSTFHFTLATIAGATYDRR